MTLVLGSAALLSGCRARYVEYREVAYASPGPAEGKVFVKVREARVRGANVRLSTVMTNQSNQPLIVHRGDWGLVLGDGTEATPRRSRDEAPIVIVPGGAKRVNVSFVAPRGADLMNARLLVQGVQLGGGEPRDLGAVSLAKGVSAFGVGGAAVEPSFPAPPSAPVDAEEAGQPPAEEPDSEDAIPETTPDDGSWQVGAGT